MHMRNIVAMIVLLCGGLNAAELKPTPKHTKTEWAIFAGTMVVEVAGTVLDMKSSLACDHVIGVGGARCTEGDPLFSSGPDHGFHTRGVVLGWGIAGGLMGTEAWLFHRHSQMWYIPAAANGAWGALHLAAWRRNETLQKEILDWRPAAVSIQ
jgi:hypothetical protein